MEIDPNLVNLMVAYAANVGADATQWVAGKFRGRVPTKVETTATSLNISVQAQLTSNGVGNAEAQKVADFLLHTPMLGYLFMLVEEAGQSEDYQGLPQEEIAALLMLEAGLSDPASSIAAEALVAVAAAANRVGRQATGHRPASSSARPLSGIQLFGAQESKRRFLRSVGTPSPKDIHEYSAVFRGEMRRKFSRIQLQHLDNGTEQRLEDLYVEPDLFMQDTIPGESDALRPKELLDSLARVVIQGPAGSGKSTTVRWLAADVASRDHGTAVPIVVELRKYSAQQALAPQTFLDHMKQSVEQITQQTPPDHWLEYVLATGRAVVFFDGLDEVLHAGTRADVRDAVLSFAQIFPATSIVVTSRFTGYDLAPFDEGEWTHIEVGELREDQVHEYASRWFELKSPNSDAQSRASSFIEESRTYARDLRANPLMLSLLCSVYYMRGDIPRTLHALYGRCADMIYQQWNTMRGIEDHRAWDKDVRPVLYQVAHAVLGNNDYLSFGIPEDELIVEVRRAFVSNGAPDIEEASRRARETVSLWSGRAWIITAVMSDGQGRSRYGFVHQSFLEYFAAVYEVRRVDTPRELYSNLRSRLIELNGWTVTQIAVSVIQDWKERGGERFLEALLDEVDDACDLDAFALWRLAISLVSVVPVPATQIAEIVRGGIRFVARSIVLTKDDHATYEANEEGRDRRREFEAFEMESHEIAASSESDSRRQSVVLPTAKSDVVLRDLALVVADGASGATVVAQATLTCMEDEGCAVLIAALLQVAILKSTGDWPDDLDARAGVLVRDHGCQTWVALWMAAQVGLLAVSDVLTEVPWHALLLEQELVVSGEIDMFGPEPLSTDLAQCMDDDTAYAILESVGETASRRLSSGLSLPVVEESHIAENFIFTEPVGGWEQAGDPDSWSDAFLVSFAMLGKLATVSWRTGHALGELADESSRDVVRQIAAASVGWGSVEQEVLAEVTEPYRSAIGIVLTGQWPTGR